MAKKSKIPGTPAVKEEQQEMKILPVELIFHLASLNVEKVQTEYGTMTILQILSPTGIGITVRMDDNDVNNLVEELKGFSIVTRPEILVP